MDIRIVCTNGGVTFNVVKNEFSPWIGLMPLCKIFNNYKERSKPVTRHPKEWVIGSFYKGRAEFIDSFKHLLAFLVATTKGCAGNGVRCYDVHVLSNFYFNWTLSVFYPLLPCFHHGFRRYHHCANHSLFDDQKSPSPLSKLKFTISCSNRGFFFFLPSQFLILLWFKQFLFQKIAKLVKSTLEKHVFPKQWQKFVATKIHCVLNVSIPNSYPNCKE